jgi:hypothetical protein
VSTLIDGMNLKGDYALSPEGDLIRLVFQREADASTFAAAVQAPKTAREGGWAGQWSFHFDAKMEAAIRAALPEKKPRAVSRRRQ